MTALLSRYRDLYQLAKLAHEPLLWSLGASFNMKRHANPSYDIIDSQWNGRDVSCGKHHVMNEPRLLYRSAFQSSNLIGWVRVY